ncbi:DUF5990 family protein [Streptomyces sp. NPDC001984]
MPQHPRRRATPRPPSRLLDLQPGDAASVTWTLECTTAASANGTDVKGPYVQGRPRGRFIYLSWGTVDDSRHSHDVPPRQAHARRRAC